MKRFITVQGNQPAQSVYSVRAFNEGVANTLQRLPTVWVEGEVTELRRQERWASVYFTLKDPESGACLPAQMPRGQFDALDLRLNDGEWVQAYGRPSLYEQRGTFSMRVLTIERVGIGAHLAALERLKQELAAEGLFAAERKRPLPRIPTLIGLVTGNDAAAKRDVLTAITTRFPPAHVLVAETYVQGTRAAGAIVTARFGADRITVRAPKRAISIRSGETARVKQIFIAGAPAAHLDALQSLAQLDG